ncbi:hypothetical protein HMPREF3034_02110 [Prevotella sp. DNF00663]|nr:hypothetical protein HMPREF3034_02110 [Prevotella sp. DNF00663]
MGLLLRFSSNAVSAFQLCCLSYAARLPSLCSKTKGNILAFHTYLLLLLMNRMERMI